jgi:hypothetical protein
MCLIRSQTPMHIVGSTDFNEHPLIPSALPVYRAKEAIQIALLFKGLSKSGL